MSEVKRFDVPSMRSLTQGEQAVMGYEVVLAYDYDALAAKLAMAEDAAAKGDAARQQCGGMEMEIEELRAELAALRAGVVVPDGWSGWATQYPGRMPTLFGTREIAELNWHPEEGARLIRLIESECVTEAPAKGVE
ncbi:hypothetical protein [Pseudomonas aeruginosa]|uniref:hypothetical protein n=1 Tax=Pseudomonas aeruginosa TaxID=287 RepID=UPI00229773D0|nr:hypothetical protein [Pseudomonas aeruginosa]